MKLGRSGEERRRKWKEKLGQGWSSHIVYMNPSLQLQKHEDEAQVFREGIACSKRERLNPQSFTCWTVNMHRSFCTVKAKVFLRAGDGGSCLWSQDPGGRSRRTTLEAQTSLGYVVSSVQLKLQKETLSQMEEKKWNPLSESSVKRRKGHE